MCDDCKNGHCHSCHREITGADHHESDGVYCEPCATYRSRIASLEAERDILREFIQGLAKAKHGFEALDYVHDAELILASIGGEGK